MDFADTLLLASTEWRGIPETFSEGALADVGGAFNTAFSEAPFATTGPGRQRAFEYFTGLLFNGDYSDLDGLTALVKSWLIMAAYTFELLETVWVLPAPRSFPRYPLYPRTLILTGEGPMYQSARIRQPEAEHFEYRVFVHVYPATMTPVIMIYPLDSGDSVARAQLVETSPDLWTAMFGYGMRETGWKIAVRELDPPTWQFTSEVLDALETYSDAVKAPIWPLAAISDTARTLNPNIFPCWAEERYGPTVAR